MGGGYQCKETPNHIKLLILHSRNWTCSLEHHTVAEIGSFGDKGFGSISHTWVWKMLVFCTASDSMDEDYTAVFLTQRKKSLKKNTAPLEKNTAPVLRWCSPPHT